MRMRTGLLALTGVLVLSMAAIAAEPGSLESRMDQFERRLADMERQHKAELKMRDEEIARLKAAMDERKAGPATTKSEADAARDEVLRDIESREAKEITNRVMASFNPGIAVITDFVAARSSRANDALNRLDVREAELDIRAAVHPKADGVLILAFERDAENPVFPEEGAEAEGVDSSVSIEEAYLFIHDTGVKNLTAKVGRFHLRFGRQNMLHLHDLPTTDPSLVSQAFLAPEALVDSGVSLSYLVPNPWNQYIEVIAEVLAGEGGGSESPTLSGNSEVDSPAFNTHLLWNTDLTKNWNLELGGSWLTGRASDDNGRNVNLFGLDATLIGRDPSGGFNNQLFQGEAIYGMVDDEDNQTQYAWGAYLLGQQQINRDWYAGLRLDWTQNPNDYTQEAWGVTPFVSWYWTEFLRFRMQYQYKDGDVPDEHILWFQATWVFGAHPPHPYWTFR